jgi:hypothetical protein
MSVLRPNRREINPRRLIGVLNQTPSVRPRTARVIRGRPWTDPVLDHAVEAVHDHYMRVGLAALTETRGDPELRSLRVEALGKAAAGWSQGIESLLAEDPANPDLWLWLGRAKIEEAWEIRPETRARAVQAAGFKMFTKAMQAARAPLMSAAERFPEDPVPWECLLWVGLGLDWEREDKDMVWAQVRRRRPTLYGAHVARVMTLSPQWGGVADEMFEFVREAARTADHTDPRAALVPLAYFEYFVQERSSILRGASSWFSDRERKEVEAAARGWFEGPHPHPRTIEAHNLFGAAFHIADARRPARQHLARTAGRPSHLPWSYLGGDSYTKACRNLKLLVS